MEAMAVTRRASTRCPATHEVKRKNLAHSSHQDIENVFQCRVIVGNC